MPSAPSRSCSARILIVDDHKLGLAARRAVLEEIGHSVETCMSGQEALDLCAQKSFDIVITDFRMPKMNGVELIKELRKSHQALSIIMISGYSDTLGLSEATTGADAVLQKNAQEVPHLIRAVARLARKQPPKKSPQSQTGAARAKRKRA